jgi:hypothetical protein
VIKSRTWVGHVAFMREMGNAYNFFGNPVGKILFERPMRRWEDGIREIEWESVDWIHLVQDMD